MPVRVKFDYLPWSTCAAQQRYDHLYLCCVAQGGQGKCNNDFHMSLSCVTVASISTLTFTNVNIKLKGGQNADIFIDIYLPKL